MTIKELINERPWELPFLDLIDFLKENDITIEYVIDELGPNAMELELSGVDVQSEPDHYYSSIIHLCMSDEVCEDEDLYDEVLEYAEEGEWEMVDEHLCTYYMLIEDDGEYLVNWLNSGITRKEMRRLAWR